MKNNMLLITHDSVTKWANGTILLIIDDNKICITIIKSLLKTIDKNIHIYNKHNLPMHISYIVYACRPVVVFIINIKKLGNIIITNIIIIIIIDQ